MSTAFNRVHDHWSLNGKFSTKRPHINRKVLLKASVTINSN
ncbi:MAG: hypothetical protein ACXAEU_18190 [Candidatus Hodarchaeales archaeon]